jgi:hypothetical protein
MGTKEKHKWTFQSRFRRNVFGWRSSPAVKRVNEAVAEILKEAKSDILCAAEGAVLFLEKVAPALEHVDSSSGAIGSAVNNAIAALVPVIAGAPADDMTRDRWMDHLWEAVQNDEMPYIEMLPEFWGDLCVTVERASFWADSLITGLRLSWSPDPKLRGYFSGTPACLSCLYAARRYEELLALLDEAPLKFWPYMKWGVKALAAMGRVTDALRYAEESRGLNQYPFQIAETCEELLISHGVAEEAYERYAFEANQRGTYLATFRAIQKKYPHKSACEILADLVRSTPGEEGKWFAAAKSAKLFDMAIDCVTKSPCDPKTLIKAARDMAESHPDFAREAGLAALRWLLEGYGYEITGLDVLSAYDCTMKAAENAGSQEEALIKIREMVAGAGKEGSFAAQFLAPRLGLPARHEGLSRR